MSFRFSKVLLALVFFVCISLLADDTDTVLSQARDIDDFLSKPELVEKYFEALQKKHGAESFHRAAYDRILQQLRDIKDKVPGLKARLWEKGPGEEFSVESLPQSHGRTVDRNAWLRYVEGLKAKIAASAGALSQMAPNEALVKAKEILLTKEEELVRFKKENLKKRTLSPEEQKKVQEYYKDLGQNSELNSAVAYLLLQHLNSEKVEDGLLNSDPNIILDTVRDLRKSPERFLSLLSQNRTLGTLTRKYIPSMQSVLAEKGLFSSVSKNITPVYTTYRFKPVSRVLDGAFKGVSLGECIGGSCYSENLASLTPIRWLSSALNGAQLYDVTEETAQKKHHKGFVQLIPIKNRRTKENYASVDFGASVFSQPVIVWDSQTGKRRQSTLLQQWLETAPQHLPKELNRFVVGESNAINNAGILNHIRGLMSYRLGKSAGDQSHFVRGDAMADSIVRNSPPLVGHATNYAGGMVFDANVPNAKELLQLEPENGSVVDPTHLQSVKSVLAGKDESLKKRLIRLIHEAYRSWPVPQEIRDLPEIRAADIESEVKSLKDRIESNLPDVYRRVRRQRLPLTVFNSTAFGLEVCLAAGCILSPGFREFGPFILSAIGALHAPILFATFMDNGMEQTYMLSQLGEQMRALKAKEKELKQVQKEIVRETRPSLCDLKGIMQNLLGKISRRQ